GLAQGLGGLGIALLGLLGLLVLVSLGVAVVLVALILLVVPLAVLFGTVVQWVERNSVLIAGGPEQWEERIAHDLDRDTAGDLASVIAGHAVGHDEEARGVTVALGDEGIAGVFVLLALLADVSFRTRNEAQPHAAPSLWLLRPASRDDPARQAHGSARRWAL